MGQLSWPLSRVTYYIHTTHDTWSSYIISSYAKIFQSYRSSAFMGQSSQNFLHLYSTTRTVYRESLRGVTAENFERIAKNREFLHLYMRKSTHGNGSSFVTLIPCDLSYTHDPWHMITIHHFILRMGLGGGVAWWYWTTLSVLRATNCTLKLSLQLW